VSRLAGRLLGDVVGQRDTCSLEDVSDLSGDVGAGGNGLAVLLDSRLLQAVEVIEERLPFGA
jgi:hypothetical protein